MKHFHQVRGHHCGKDPWRDNPAEKTADQPVRFPGPAFYLAERHVKTAGRQPAQPVINHADDWICRHGAPSPYSTSLNTCWSIAWIREVRYRCLADCSG